MISFLSALTVASAAAAEDIVVTATRQPIPLQQSPGAIDVVDANARRENSAGIDLSELLSRVPGLNIQNRFNYAQDTQISSRGFGSRASFGIRGIRLYVDDIPVTIPDGQAQGALIPIAAVTSIEVLRGPWSLVYGNAAGGVIAATTRIPKEANIASIRTWRGQDGVAVDQMQVSGAMTDSVAGLASWQRFQTDGYRAQSAAKREQLYAKLDVTPNSTSRLSLILNKIDQHLSLDPLGLTQAQLAENPRQAGTNAILFNTRKTISHQQIGAVFEQQWQSLTAKVIAYQGKREVVQFLATPIAAQAPATSAGGVIDLDRDFGGVGLRLSGKNIIDWLIGVDVDSAADNRRGFENFVRVDAATTRLGTQGALRRDEINRQQSRDVFLQFSVLLRDNWNAYAAVRRSQLRFRVEDHYIRAGNADDSGARDFAAISPALGLVKNWRTTTSQHSLNASIGAGFETPTAAEMAYRADQLSGLNLQLQASRNRQIEIGYRFLSPTVDIRASTFAIQSRDEIVAANTVAGRSSFQNAAGTARLGAELSSRATLAADWQAGAALTIIRASIRDDYVAGTGTAARLIRAGNILPAVPQRQLQADIAWRAGRAGFSAAMEVIARSSMFADDANLAKAAGYARLNANLNYRQALQIAKHKAEIGATFRIENALNHVSIGSVIVNDANQRYFEPSPERRAMIGLSGKLWF